jgi:UDP-N-acetylglucosamine--N-acetylmuramyl-(pentapeptide) pyrophosphoryl-undecaprenol N-acetylglucosamine transferase
VLNLFKLTRGFWAALSLGRRERPQALFVTGGYASVPVALAAWVLRIPILLYLPDIEPGLAVRFIARLAKRIGVTTEDSIEYFPADKVVVSGYPIRPEFATCERSAARRKLGLGQREPVLLVFGGSHGARSINMALVEGLTELLQQVQVVHISGELDWPWVSQRAEQLPSPVRMRYHLHSYMHEIWEAFAAADLAVCRAGASTLGELPFFGLPAVLVPYPHAWRYQRVNAEWLAGRGAAVQLKDEQLGRELLPLVRDLLGQRERLAQMSQMSRALARPQSAARLADELRALVRQDPGGRLQ